MIPFNPCGLVCDFGRHRYKTKCRFFKDSDRVDEITWYPAAPHAKFLPFPSIFYQSIWDRDPDEIDGYVEGPGEVWDEQHKTTDMVAPPGSGTGHYCGTPEMFLEGAHYDPAFRVAIRADGLPVCCPGGIGGLFWGGRGVTPPRAQGGMQWRGDSPSGWDHLYYGDESVFGEIPFFESVLRQPGPWETPLGGIVLSGPVQTGIPQRWEVYSPGTYPGIDAGLWRVDGWSGWGHATLTLVSGGPTPATWTFRRNDGF